MSTKHHPATDAVQPLTIEAAYRIDQCDSILAKLGKTQRECRLASTVQAIASTIRARGDVTLREVTTLDVMEKEIP